MNHSVNDLSLQLNIPNEPKYPVKNGMANIYLDIGDYGKAVRAARTALGKGKLRRPDQMYVTWGMALYNLDQLDTSRTQFEKAAKHRRSRQLATDWIEFLDSELLRRAALEDGLG